MSAAAWTGVALLGGLGAVMRHLVDSAVTARAGDALPLGILMVNVSGAFALGLLVGAGAVGEALIVAGTGFLGAFTTFSTWMVQTRALAGEGRRGWAAIYVLVSLIAGFLAVAAGRGLA